jgi:hypothetical protein
VVGAQIVGIAELSGEERTICGEPISANAVAIAAAAADAAIPVQQVDSVLTYDSLIAPDILQANRVAEYAGIKPGYAATIGAAGATPTTAVVMAAALIAAGRAGTVAIAHSDFRASADRAAVIAQMADNVGNTQFEAPFGPIIPTMYSLLSDWLLGRGWATPRDLAEIAVQTRRWASLNANAAKTDALTIEQVLDAPKVAGSLGRYDCCLVTDFAGALIVSTEASQPVGRAVRLRGAGGAASNEEISQMNPDNPLEPAEAAAGAVFAQAEMAPGDIDAAYLYDSFTITVALQLIAYGFTDGEPLGTLLEQAGIGPGGRLPVNTHGGLLSASTSGIFHLIEAVRQLRGEAGRRQVPDARLALVANVGGVFSNHCTVVLEAAR